MTCHLSKQELYVLWKLFYRCDWYPQHIDRRDVVKGRPKSEINEYRDAIDSLVKKQYLTPYKAQGRDDVGLTKQYRNEIRSALESHKAEYDFIIFREQNF